MEWPPSLGRRERTDRDVVSVRIADGEFPRLTATPLTPMIVHVRFIAFPFASSVLTQWALSLRQSSVLKHCGDLLDASWCRHIAPVS
jgi:hypothetical protein